MQKNAKISKLRKVMPNLRIENFPAEQREKVLEWGRKVRLRQRTRGYTMRAALLDMIDFAYENLISKYDISKYVHKRYQEEK